MENSSDNRYSSGNDWQHNDNMREESTLSPGTAGNISSPTDQYTGSEYRASDRQDDPGNSRENDTDAADGDYIEDDVADANTKEDRNNTDADDADDDDLRKSDWGDVDPAHDGSSSNEPSFPGSAI
jgi:hypothetical protein